ncbi:hypothetical protein V1514DRAFT_328081 [Lipomyces japonicus]|uniref:uncharacterized protein n=1 Tax=Lipomyces japonicus TaxID=56871 RepID=UPI0034CD1A82
MSEVAISIHTVSTSPVPKPHTVYHIQLRLALRSYTVMKRYSDFDRLLSDMETAVGQTSPFKLPKKKLFGSDSAAIIEQRRVGLETFLKDVNKSSDSRWRQTDAWRGFLGLSTKNGGQGGSSLLSSTSVNASLLTPSGKNISDPVVWLETLHDIKSLLHDARNYLSDRDSLGNSGLTRNGVPESVSAAAEAKKSLVQSSTKIVLLERGLKQLRDSVGEGELRRRTDLLNLVKREREGLEKLASTISARPPPPPPFAATAGTGSTDDSPDKQALLSGGKAVLGSVASSAKRVLGPLTESAETRQLDNQGLLNLQMQKMDDQEETLLEFSKILQRQKQIGIDINDELELQTEMVRMLEDDVENSGAKLNRAGKNLKKIK